MSNGVSMFAALAVAFLLLAAPTASAQLQNPDQSTQTRLYFHIFDVFNRFVVNTQPMDADFFKVGGTNNPTTPPIPEAAPDGMDYNTIYGVSTAGPVEYDFIENGLPRLHPERGIAADVRIDPDVQPVAIIYLDVRDVFGTDGFANVLPDFKVRVTMREGDDPGRDADLDAGDLIMQGDVTLHGVETTTAPGAFVNGFYGFWAYTIGLPPNPMPLPEDGAGFNDAFAGQSGPDGNPVAVPDSQGVIEIRVPLDIEQPLIPKSEAYNIRIDWWMLEEAFGEDGFSTSYFRFVADQDHLPHLDLAVMNPIFIEFIHPQVAAGTLLIHTGVNSPWGTYDVDVDNITLQMEGPTEPLFLNQVVTQNAHVHGLHDQAAEITYLWKFRDEGAAQGQYRITMDVPNLNGTAVASGAAGFAIEGARAFGISDEGDVVEPTVGDGDEGSPAPAAFGILALLAAAVVAGRRRL